MPDHVEDEDQMSNQKLRMVREEAWFSFPASVGSSTIDTAPQVTRSTDSNSAFNLTHEEASSLHISHATSTEGDIESGASPKQFVPVSTQSDGTSNDAHDRTADSQNSEPSLTNGSAEPLGKWSPVDVCLREHRAQIRRLKRACMRKNAVIVKLLYQDGLDTVVHELLNLVPPSSLSPTDANKVASEIEHLRTDSAASHSTGLGNPLSVLADTGRILEVFKDVAEQRQYPMQRTQIDGAQEDRLKEENVLKSVQCAIDAIRELRPAFGDEQK